MRFHAPCLPAVVVLSSMVLWPAATTLGQGRPPVCREVATELAIQMSAPGGFSATSKIRCTLNAAAKQSTCTFVYSDSQGTTSESTSTSTYNSIADIVDEMAVNPPLIYAATVTATQTGNRGKSSGSVTNTFDAQRRITKTVNANERGESTTTYTAWDAAGRPTQTQDVGKGFSNSRSIVYDDRARTKTTVVNGGPLRTVETFDGNGNQIETLAMSGGSSVQSKTAITVLASARVCK